MENGIRVAVVAVVLVTAAFALAYVTVRAIYAGALFLVGFGAMRIMKGQDRVAREIPLTRQRLGLDP